MLTLHAFAKFGVPTSDLARMDLFDHLDYLPRQRFKLEVSAVAGGHAGWTTSTHQMHIAVAITTICRCAHTELDSFWMAEVRAMSTNMTDSF